MKKILATLCVCAAMIPSIARAESQEETAGKMLAELLSAEQGAVIYIAGTYCDIKLPHFLEVAMENIHSRAPTTFDLYVVKWQKSFKDHEKETLVCQPTQEKMKQMADQWKDRVQ